jgi:hypothetical protein
MPSTGVITIAGAIAVQCGITTGVVTITAGIVA